MKLVGAEVIAAGSDSFIETWENMADVPVLIAKRLGKGIAFLVNSIEFPGYHGLRRFYKDLLYFFAAAWHKDIIVETCDRVRFGIYNEGDMYIIYLLNTDPNCTHSVIISSGLNSKISLNVEPGELRVVYTNERFLISPENNRMRIIKIGLRGSTLCLSLYKKKECHGKITCFVDGNIWKGKISFS